MDLPKSSILKSTVIHSVLAPVSHGIWGMFGKKINETHKSPVIISKNFRKFFMFKIVENIPSLEKNWF